MMLCRKCHHLESYSEESISKDTLYCKCHPPALSKHLNIDICIVCIYISSFSPHVNMSFVMLHGIAVLSLNKGHGFVNVLFCPMFMRALLQIKVYNDVILLIAG